MPWYKIVIILICAFSIALFAADWWRSHIPPPPSMIALISIVLYALFPKGGSQASTAPKQEEKPAAAPEVPAMEPKES